MSKFKRSFLAPNQLYKSLYTTTLGDSPPDNRNDRHKAAAAQVCGLQLCRGTSVVCDNVEVNKENKPLSKRIQASPASKKGSLDPDVCKKSCLIEKEDKVTLKIETESLRQPLCPLSENVLPKPATAKRVEMAVPRCSDNDENAPLFAPPTPNRSKHVWDDDPDCDAAPASSWSALGNRYLLCRPLPLDVGRCACYILHERDGGADSPIVYSLYTDEGHGRPDRRLAVARHRRRSGRSEFIIGQDVAGTSLAKREEGFMGRVSANIVGSRYHIWDEASPAVQKFQGGRQLLGVTTFDPTVTTLTGTFRVMRVYIPKYQSLHISNANQHEAIGLCKDWEENMGRVHGLCSRKPHYNRALRRYELDYRERTRSGNRIQSSSKNFQLVMEEHGKQVILLHGKVGNAKYIMEYSFPLTAYQAFGICLSSIDSKLCCTV